MPKRQTERYTCNKCGASLDYHKSKERKDSVCPVLGCDGTMLPYRPRYGKSEPFTLTPAPEITAPNTTKQSLGFTPGPIEYKSYDEYLGSELWQHIRGAVYRRDKGKCRVCGRDGSVVHHLSYAKEVMEGRDLEKLVLVCRPCHKHIEFDKYGNKRSVGKAAAAFRRMAKASQKKREKKSRNKNRKRWRYRRKMVARNPSVQRRN